VEQHFQQAHHPGVLDLDAGDLCAAGWDWQGQALEEREIHMHVGQVGFQAGHAVRHCQKPSAQRVQILQSLVHSQVFQPVNADLQTQERGKLFVHPHHQAPAIDPQQ